MNPLTLEWILKADGDFSTAGRELRVRRTPNYDASCFHSQQAAEKYLKAYLQEHGFSIPKTHILLDLLGLCLRIDATFQIIRPDINELEGYAVQFRYPGQSADKSEARFAFKNAAIIRDFIRNRLNL